MLKILIHCWSGRLHCRRAFSRMEPVTRISSFAAPVETKMSRFEEVTRLGNTFSKHEGCQVNMFNQAATCSMTTVGVFLAETALTLLEARQYLGQLLIYTKPLVEGGRLCP